MNLMNFFMKNARFKITLFSMGNNQAKLRYITPPLCSGLSSIVDSKT